MSARSSGISVMRTCASCGSAFPGRVLIDGRVRSLSMGRKFCLSCSPFGSRNTSCDPATPARQRRQRSWNSYHARRRYAVRQAALLVGGARCRDCGHERAAALDLHHRERGSKCFAISAPAGPGSWRAVRTEIEKCVVLCANCHRRQHADPDGKSHDAHPVVAWRRRTKRRAMALLGGACVTCGFDAVPAALEFHHRRSGEKEFAISDGTPRAWRRVVTELAKCDLLCANCHREVHAAARAS